MRVIDGFCKGINFGGWMSHEHYAPEHIASFIKEEDFSRIKSWGLDHVRIPVDYNLFEGNDAIGFQYLDFAAQCCEKYDLRMIIDLHKAAGFSYESAYGESGLFESTSYQKRFCDTWESFAKRYGSKPDRIAFELLNEITEPAYIDAWNRIAAETISAIRKYAPETWILVGSYHHNAVDALPALHLPQDNHLVLNFHCYDPIGFTHQRAYWMPAMRKDFTLDYPCTKEAYHAAMATMPGLGADDFVDAGESPAFDSQYFIARFAEAAALAEKLNLPLYCGEYGVIEHASDESALRWYKDIHDAFETYGIGRAAWSYRKMDFGLEQRPAVLEQLIANL